MTVTDVDGIDDQGRPFALVLGDDPMAGRHASDKVRAEMDALVAEVAGEELSGEVAQLYREDQPREHGRFAPADGGGAGDTAKGDKAAKADKPAAGPKVRPVRPVKGMKVDGQAVNAWAVKTADGQKVKLYQVPHIGIGGVEHGAVRPETVSKLLNGVANAYDRDPRPEGKGTPTIRIESTGDYYGRLRDQGVDENQAYNMMQTTLAYVDTARPGEITALRQNIDQPPSETPKLDSIMGGTGWHMPAEEALKAQGNAAGATMAHEYGHVRYYDNANWSVPAAGGMRDAVLRDRRYYQDKANLLLYKPEVRAALSEYGKSNYMEAHAEAYAEWSLTDGKTDNFAAKAFAEGFGWKSGRAAKTAGRVERFEFDPEKHPKDEHGRWAGGGGSAGPEAKAPGHFVVEGAVPEHDRLAVHATLTRLTERYPIGEVRLKFATGEDSITQYANAQHGDPADHQQIIHVNADEWTKQAATREKEMRPYLVDATQTTGTLTHEYGHLVYNHLTKTLGEADRAELDRIVDTGGGNGTKDFGQGDIPSIYSTESRSEMSAELFAAHVAQHFDNGRGFDNPYGPKAVERVRAYEKLLTKAFG